MRAQARVRQPCPVILANTVLSPPTLLQPASLPTCDSGDSVGRKPGNHASFAPKAADEAAHPLREEPPFGEAAGPATRQ